MLRTAAALAWDFATNPIDTGRYARSCMWANAAEMQEAYREMLMCPECVEDGGACTYHQARIEYILYEEYGYAPIVGE